jgi:thymidylate kinase
VTNAGFWLSVDGIDGAGKTTIALLLSARMGATLSEEFSRSIIGDALRTSVSVAPNYILRSKVGQSLVFLGDFFEVYETQIRPIVARGSVVVSDRGWLSKYAYQFVTLVDDLGAEEAGRLLNSMLGLLPRPDLTIYLDASLDVIQQRITHRDGVCGHDRLLFNSLAANAARMALHTMSASLPCEIIDANATPAEIVRLALAAYESRSRQ